MTKPNDYFRVNIENTTKKNKHYRKVIYTDKFQQIALMSINVGESISQEKHSGTQFFRVESGKGTGLINNKKILLSDGISLVVPYNTLHTITNTSKTLPLKLYTIYTPPQHKHNTISARQSS